MIKTPVGWVIRGDDILPSYVGIRIGQYKDPYKPTDVIECHIRVLITAQVQETHCGLLAWMTD